MLNFRGVFVTRNIFVASRPVQLKKRELLGIVMEKILLKYR